MAAVAKPPRRRFESEPIVPRNTAQRALISQQCVATIADDLIVAGRQGEHAFIIFYDLSVVNAVGYIFHIPAITTFYNYSNTPIVALRLLIYILTSRSSSVFHQPTI